MRRHPWRCHAWRRLARARLRLWGARDGARRVRPLPSSERGDPTDRDGPRGLGDWTLRGLSGG